MELKNWTDLERMASYVGVEIDKTKPRESRLKVALKCDENSKISEAIEAMTGIPLHEYDTLLLFTLNMRRQNSTDPTRFYEELADADE